LTQGAYIVADFGKTLSKVTLWSKDGQMIDRVVRPNGESSPPATDDKYRALNVRDVKKWLIATLARFAAHPVEAIIPVAHGAAVAALLDDELAFDPMDYEHAIPAHVLAEYRMGRDRFAITGSPALPDGLNIGSQLHWLEQMDGARFRDATLLPYAQYWAWLLSGQARSEVTSLGSHSDLWAPLTADFAPMAKARGWAAQFAPMAMAGDVIGYIRPELADQTGLPASVRIYAGLHDSNAALLAARGFAEIAGQEATVLSTGTWFIAMRSPRSKIDIAELPEARDCLLNVDAFGAAIPSARFMGGREIETLIEIDTRRVDIKPDQPDLLAAVADVIAAGTMLLPTFAPGSGPFAAQKGRWINRPDNWFARRAAACLYAALVADTSLSLIGAKATLLVEGRFAEAEVFVRALASLRPDMAVYTANAHNDVSFGALRLIDPALRPDAALVRVTPLPQALADYRAQWQKTIEEGRVA
jgi:sugar (pentulose or hexulose) kinase